MTIELACMHHHGQKVVPADTLYSFYSLIHIMLVEADAFLTVFVAMVLLRKMRPCLYYSVSGQHNEVVNEMHQLSTFCTQSNHVGPITLHDSSFPVRRLDSKSTPERGPSGGDR